jgi:hypothetical protein
MLVSDGQATSHRVAYARRQLGTHTTQKAMRLHLEHRWIAVGLIAALLVGRPGGAQQSASSLERWERFDFSHQHVDSLALSDLPLSDLRRLRGIVFGRHGRPFPDEPDIRDYLATRHWYHADPRFSNARLNAAERRNLDVIRGAEARRHQRIETGDMRYLRDRPVTQAMLGHHSAADWRVIAAEVEAVHGKRFEEEEPDSTDENGKEIWALQQYFEERYWYHGRAEYSPRELSAIESANLDTIELARMRDLGYAVAPGMMYLFRATPLSDSLLSGVSLHDLRLLRNEVFARRGRRFQTPWLQEYFSAQHWYRPRADFRDSDLSEIEKSNVKLITATEARRHEELATRVLNLPELQGLYPETARRLRNEIFARHGRIFRDRRLQSYFASQDWYHADPHFDERSLSAIERQNAQTILEHEQRAKRGQRFTPG